MKIDKQHLKILLELINIRYTLRQLMLTEGMDVTIRVIDGVTMVQCPDGMFVEIHPHELYIIKKRHKIIVTKE